MGNIEVGLLFPLKVHQIQPNLVATPVILSDAIVQKTIRPNIPTGQLYEPPSPSTRSNYFVTKPPDSPRNDTPTSPYVDKGLTNLVTTRQTPGPRSPFCGLSNTLDLCLSRAINTLSLKCKGSDESPPLVHPTKLLKWVTSHQKEHQDCVSSQECVLSPLSFSNTSFSRAHGRNQKKKFG